MADKELEKKIIELPKLPNVIQGDGRQLMSLLKSFLTQTAEQVNLANGFSAEEIKPNTDGKVPTPRNLFITFNRLGAVVTWNHIPDVSVLAYYELRENTNVGSNSGLLLRTVENEVINKVPISFSSRIYLYAVNKDGEYSNTTYVDYTKPRPNSPQDISLTKNNEGTLITFLEIPTNCIGANVYIDNEKFQTMDNVFLFAHDDKKKIKKVEVAYYDVFGEGERGVINCVVPNVTGFLVERNGANLDFYWDSVNIYGVTYAVRVGVTESWNSAVEVFRTKLNKHRYVYPNPGNYCFLIKAMDVHGNTSEYATYVYTDNAIDLSKNVILDFSQDNVAYSGNKINMYYDVGLQGLKLEREALYGEYMMNITLPQKYRARNWLDMSIIGITNSNIKWSDCTFTWNSEEASKMTWAGERGGLEGLKLSKQIATYKGVDTVDIDCIRLNGNLTTEKGTEPTIAVKANNFTASRWANGLTILDTTQLEYTISNITNVFSIAFCIKKTKNFDDCIFMTLANSEEYFLMLGFDKLKNVFYLTGSDGVTIYAQIETLERDWLTFGISQGSNDRTLFVHSLTTSKYAQEKATVLPVGKLTNVYCYPKLIN